jgi:hypothetical protein
MLGLCISTEALIRADFSEYPARIAAFVWLRFGSATYSAQNRSCLAFSAPLLFIVSPPLFPVSGHEKSGLPFAGPPP